ncbi:MAG: response regulator [Candidatus Omnitrophica bacterium]|nr:response regulator [Candidatus Omnitrophota bacterium]MCA9432906.1 response regulator [Candidatus Omnitrophota bacterium]MCA9434288.1 response regulator [Candidatus Omnitrophota bacterium]MCA9443585.1 response regulator [Candidatus Omnitrophota bacterium]MCB9767207.1 response regulator [Candidatus Omnitrophota bacterium]
MEKIRILHVEDDLLDRKSFVRLVESRGLSFEVTSADSLQAARRLVKDQDFDLILVDHHLGDGSGIELIKQGLDSPAIIVTGAGDEVTAVSALRAGAYDYVIKDDQSSYVSVLPEVIANVLKRRKTEEERDRLIQELQDALATIKTLKGLIPICSMCKKVRDDEGFWTEVDSYLKEHSEAQISHGLCPDCFELTLADLEEATGE